MGQLDQRAGRLYGPGFSLWDVRDVEAHVRATLQAALDAKSAYLKPEVKDKFVEQLVIVCWRLSGLEADGRTPRLEHFAEIRVAGRTKTVSLGPYRSEEVVQQAVADWRAAHVPVGVISFVGYRSQRPRGAYDPSRGISFSTYSRGVVTKRVVDCFRGHLGDSRYGQKPRELSLDQLIDEQESTTLLDLHGPGARSDFIDELNPHAYYDPFADTETDAMLIALPEGDEFRAAAAG